MGGLYMVQVRVFRCSPCAAIPAEQSPTIPFPACVQPWDWLAVNLGLKKEEK